MKADKPLNQLFMTCFVLWNYNRTISIIDLQLYSDIPLCFYLHTEQHLPSDEPCLSLLTTWNDSAGKEKSFISVAECLKKIGRNKLAEWLSNTVFTQLSMELNNCFLCNNSLQRTTVASTTSDFLWSRPRLNIRPETK